LIDLWGPSVSDCKSSLAPAPAPCAMSEFVAELHERAQKLAAGCDPRDRARIAAAVRPGANVTRANALLSEFARDKRHAAALLTLDALLQQRPPRATDHTLAAFVNACAGGGDPDLALAAVRALPRLVAGVRVGVVAHTALVKALAGAGRLAEARQVVAQMPANGEDAPNVRTFHSLLRGALRTGDVAAVRDTLRIMRASASARPDSTALEYAAKALANAGAVDEALSLATELDRLPGGPLPSSVAAVRVAIATSLALLGRASEARTSLRIARTALDAPPAAMASAASPFPPSCKSQAQFGEHQRRELRRDADNVQSFLDATCTATTTTTTTHKQGGMAFRGSPHVVIAPPASSQTPSPTPTDWSAALSFPQQRKLRVELCSGSGEWVVQHAVADGPDVAWVAVEILYDRAHSIWARAAMAGVSNRVAVLCADALAVLREALVPGSVDALFVNFPEPAPAGNTHFIHTAAFAAAVRKVLAPSARLVLVTDNRALASGAARVLSEVAFCGSVLIGTDLPPGFGFRSSYFDRLWVNGNRVERHVVQAIKI